MTIQAAPLLAFVRHGETEWNRQGRFVGSRDIGLNGEGRRQARRNAESLRHLLASIFPDGLVGLATSPLARARETAEVIMGVLGRPPVEIIVDERLRELSFGDWEGLTTAQIKRTSNDARRARRAQIWTTAPPGGESYLARVPDVGAFLAEAAAGTVVVAHSGIIRIIAHLLAGLPPVEAARLTVPHDGVLLWHGGRLQWHGIVAAPASWPPDSGLSAPGELR